MFQSNQNRERQLVWGLFFAAAFIRLLASRWAPDIDAAGLYLRRAQELLGQLPWTSILWTYWVHPPGASLLAVPALASHLGYEGAQATMALLSATAVPGLWLVGRNSGLSNRACAAWALMLCVSPAFFFSGGQVVPEVPLVALAIWMVWAVQRQHVWFAAVVALLAVLMKEEALALSIMGLIAAIINQGFGSRKAWRWLTPLCIATFGLACWYAIVGLSSGYMTSSAHVQEFAFTAHQISHPLALIKRVVYVSWQAVFVIGLGVACAPLVSMAFGLATVTAKDFVKSKATSIAAVVVGIVLLGWHSIVGHDVLVRYMLPAAALFIAAGAAAGDNHLRPFGRSVITNLLMACATLSLVWLLADLRFVGKGTSVMTISGPEFSRESTSSVLEDRSIKVILSTRQPAVSRGIYEDTYILQEVERIAADRQLVFMGTSALFVTQIEAAMNHPLLELTSDAEKKTALLINNFTPLVCTLAIAKIAQAPENSTQIQVTRIRAGKSVAYIAQTRLSTPECEIGAEH